LYFLSFPPTMFFTTKFRLTKPTIILVTAGLASAARTGDNASNPGAVAAHQRPSRHQNPEKAGYVQLGDESSDPAKRISVVRNPVLAVQPYKWGENTPLNGNVNSEILAEFIKENSSASAKTTQSTRLSASSPNVMGTYAKSTPPKR